MAGKVFKKTSNYDKLILSGSMNKNDKIKLRYGENQIKMLI